MLKPLSYLVLAFVVACVALFMLLPGKRIEQRQQQIAQQQTLPAAPAKPQASPAITTSVEPSAAANETGSVLPEPAVQQKVSVEGRIENAEGTPLAGFDVVVESSGFDGEGLSIDTRVSDARGNFRLRLVPERRYKLAIRAAGDYAGYRLDDFTHADSETLQNIVLERIEPVDADGLIVDADGAPVADFELQLRHQTLQYPEVLVRSDSSGYFSLSGIPAGEWTVAANQAHHFRIKGLDLRPGEYRNLTLVIDRGSYHLSGWVHDINSLPVAGARVTVRSALTSEDTHSYSYRSFITDATGAFEFTGLGGHPVALGVHRNGYKTRLIKHEFASFSDSVEIEMTPE